MWLAIPTLPSKIIASEYIPALGTYVLTKCCYGIVLMNLNMNWIEIISVVASITAIITGLIQLIFWTPEIKEKLSKEPSWKKRLRQLLALGKWKEADEETTKILLKIANREQEEWLNVVDFKNNLGDFQKIDRRTLITIDRLWINYSKGRFGFSIQKNIWNYVQEKSAIGGYAIRKRFADLVDWRIDAEWIEKTDPATGKTLIDRNKLTFNLNAPEGHLPLGVSEGYQQKPFHHPGERLAIFKYLEICEIGSPKNRNIFYEVTLVFLCISVSIIIALIIFKF